jgi:hypothetical protein
MLDPVIAFFERIFHAIGRGIGMVISALLWPFVPLRLFLLAIAERSGKRAPDYPEYDTGVKTPRSAIAAYIQAPQPVMGHAPRPQMVSK